MTEKRDWVIFLNEYGNWTFKQSSFQVGDDGRLYIYNADGKCSAVFNTWSYIREKEALK